MACSVSEVQYRYNTTTSRRYGKCFSSRLLRAARGRHNCTLAGEIRLPGFGKAAVPQAFDFETLCQPRAMEWPASPNGRTKLETGHGQDLKHVFEACKGARTGALQSLMWQRVFVPLQGWFPIHVGVKLAVGNERFGK